MLNELHIRWMIRRDIDEVLAIERASFDMPWTEEEFFDMLRQRNVIGMVVEDGERVVGFMVYQLQKDRIHVLNLAVHPDCRREKVGTMLIDKLKGKLSCQRRKRLVLEVRESNLAAQMFFRELGFRAIRVEHGIYDGSDEDAYVMQYRLPVNVDFDQPSAA